MPEFPAPDSAREELIGYFAGALEDEERRRLETRLRDSAALRDELRRLRRRLTPLAMDREPLRPPLGLWKRTCRLVEVTSHVLPGGTFHRPGGWSLRDTVAAAVILIAVGLMLFPAVSRSRFHANVAGCQFNLERIGMALHEYSDNQLGDFPQIPTDGNAAFVGVYATKLRDAGVLPDGRIILCPAVVATREEPLRIPSLREIQMAKGLQLLRLRRGMASDYGYSMGILVNDKYVPIKNLNRATFAIMADAPSPALDGRPSANHGSVRQNVLFENLNVRFMRIVEPLQARDYFFLNDDGQVAPGRHRDDSVIGPSHAIPVSRSR